MNPQFIIKPISYYPLLIGMVIVCISLLYVSVSFNFTIEDFILSGIGLFALWYVLHYFLSGKFIADIDENNNLIISWVKKPFLSFKKDRVINIKNIVEAYTPTNYSFAPDKYVIKIKNEKSFSFFDPIIINNKGFKDFQSILRYYILLNENKNGLQQKI